MGATLTRKDIAAAAGVSPSTVSRALSGSRLLPKRTIERVRRLAEEMGYQPNELARRLASNRSRQIGLVAPLGVARKGTFQMSYFSSILDAMVAAAFRGGYSISIHPHESAGRKRVENLTLLARRKQVDGLVLIGLKQSSKIPLALAKAEVPLVLIGSHSRIENVVSVNCDPGPGVRRMTGELERRGYRNLYFVQGNLDYYDATAQKKALLAALKTSTLRLTGIIEGNYSRRSGYAAAAAVIPKLREKSCVFLANDRMAMGFYRFCQEKGVAIPRRIGVVGSDDDEAGTALCPELTTIRQPRQEMGRTAVELMIEILGGKAPESVRIPKVFIMRNSC